MSRIFAMGDIHGAYRALRQCFERSEFDFETDHLICLGDVADGWPETKASINELIRVKNLTYVLGNHDWWTLQWMTSGKIEDLWYIQGGKATIDSYKEGIPDDHILFLSEAVRYHEHEDRLFVHGGIDPDTPLDAQGDDTFLWDRALASRALDLYGTGPQENLTEFRETYIGHTPIPYPHPIHSAGVWLMDTGAGWSGVLSMMDINSKEVFSSDRVSDLYPGVQGRQKVT